MRLSATTRAGPDQDRLDGDLDRAHAAATDDEERLIPPEELHSRWASVAHARNEWVRARLFLLTSSLSFVMVGLACLPDLVLSNADADAAQAKPCGDGVVDLDAEQCDPGPDAALGCTATCVIDCDGGIVNPSTNHCYFWTTTTDTIDHASTYCNLAGGPNAHLVGFADQDELSFVGPGTKNLANAPDGGGGTWAWLEKTGGTNDAGYETYYVPSVLGATLPGWVASCPGCFANADGGDGGGFSYAGQNPQVCVFWKKGPRRVGCSRSVRSGETPYAVVRARAAGAFSAPCPDGGWHTCIRVPRTASDEALRAHGRRLRASTTRASACASRGGMLARFESGAEREEVIAEVARVIGWAATSGSASR